MHKVVSQGERTLESFSVDRTEVDRTEEEQAQQDRVDLERFTKWRHELIQAQESLPVYRLSQFIQDAEGYLEVLDGGELCKLRKLLAYAIEKGDRVTVKSVRAIFEFYPAYEREIGLEVDDESVDDESLRFSDDYRSARWGDLRFKFSNKQSAVMEILYKNWLQGTPMLSKESLLEAANSDGKDVRDLFRRHDAWGSLIIKGTSPGTWRLAPESP